MSDVNLKVDKSSSPPQMRLVEIPGFESNASDRWRIKTLEIDGKNPALSTLLDWSRAEPRDYKKIIRSLRMVAANRWVRDEKFATKSDNPAHGDVYEARADKLHARLMFFYDRDSGDAVAVCTNPYWKGSGSQDHAFAICAAVKRKYEEAKRCCRLEQ